MTGLRELFKSKLQITPDYLRVLNPEAYKLKNEPCGPALNLGIIKELFQPEDWPDKFDFYDEDLTNAMYSCVRDHIPGEAIEEFNAYISDLWLAPGQGRMFREPHLDGMVLTAGNRFGATASLIPTVGYPRLSPSFHSAQNYDDLAEKYTGYEEPGIPGAVMFWNEDSFIHRAAINDKCREEWLERFKFYTGGEKLVREDGSVRSVLVKGTIQLRLDWLYDVQRFDKFEP